MKKSLLILLILLTIFPLKDIIANNVQVTIPTLLARDIYNHSISVKFDVSWENSWRTNSAPYNWDAVWFFIKYKKISDGKWYHATLSINVDDHNTGSQGIGGSFSVPSSGKGVMFYRSDEGTGNFSSTGVNLRWNYGLDSLSDNITSLISHIKVFAVEMVYIPEGSFYLGSGGTESNHFYEYPTEASPYQVTSEGEIPVGSLNGFLNYTNGTNSGDHLGPIPASFPKGYNSFYCMKYEITQEQYADFLNTLTPTQLIYRFPNQFNNYRHYIKNQSGIIGCDGNNNNILNEINDGQNIACNDLTWLDGIAYAAWSGMRPMTELEFEKICRGTLEPVANEYSWGSTNIIQATGITNPKANNEATTPINANCNYNNATGIMGPIRVGSFARNNSDRHSSGSSYYGVMELSGNLWERCVTIGNINGRNFTGLLGNGVLDENGNANITNWPGSNGNSSGSGFRGGSCYFSDYCRVSNRFFSTLVNNNRSYDYGFRCVIGIF